MKITILKYGVRNTDSLTQGLQAAQELLKNIGLLVEFSYKDVNTAFSSIPVKSDLVTSGYMVEPNSILSLVDGKEDIALLIYDWSKISPQPTNPVTTGIMKGKAIPMQIPEQWYGYPDSYPVVLTEFFLHELCHALYILTGQGTADKTHFQYSNPSFMQSTPTQYFLYLLTSLTVNWNKMNPQTTQPIYKYFNPKSDPVMVGLSPKLMSILDSARGISNSPYKLTSGFRTPAQNSSAGGKANSAHLRGLAVDIDCPDNFARTKILRGLINCGSPIFIEDAIKHIHIDIDPSIHALGQTIVSNDE